MSTTWNQQPTRVESATSPTVERQDNRSVALLVAMLLFAFLPFHFVLLSLATRMGVPPTMLRVLPLWKELLLMTLFALALPGVIGGGRRLRICRMDLIVLSFFLLWAIYSYNAFFFSIRTAVFFFGLPYVLGRLFSVSDANLHRVIQVLLLIAFIAPLSAIFERFFLPPDFWVHVGLVDYLSFTGATAEIPAPYGLPWTFFNSLGIQRAGGIFANPLDLAQGLAVLVAIPTTSLLISRHIQWRDLVLLGLIFTSVVLSGSRTNIVVVSMIVLAILLRRSFHLFLLAAAAGGTLLLGILTISERLRNFVISSLIFEEHSSWSHLIEWIEGWEAFQHQPWGYGIGTSGFIGKRLGTASIGGESDYIVKLVQMGGLGLLLYITLLATGVWLAWSWFARSRKLSRERTIIVALSFAALLVIALAGLTSEVSLFPRIVGWFLLGCTCSIAIQQRTMLMEQETLDTSVSRTQRTM